MGKFRDLTGQKFGKFTVVKYIGQNSSKRSTWLCRCDCGTEKIMNGHRLTSGDIKSCGCSRKGNKGRETHGMCGTKIYSLWKSIRARCYKKNFVQYKDYGGRGIKVCNRWQKFENFLEDMGDTIPKGMSIDRIDNDGDYSPENCRWATRFEQANNKRDNIFITYNGETLTLSQWSRKLNIKYMTLYHRLKSYKWSIEKSFTESIG